MRQEWENLELQVTPFDSDEEDLISESQDKLLFSDTINLEFLKKTAHQRTRQQYCDRTFGDYSYRNYDLFQDPLETGHPLFWVTTKQYNPVMYAHQYHNAFVYLSDRYELLYFFDKKPDQVMLKDPYQFIRPASKMMITRYGQYTQVHLPHEKIKKWITLNGDFRPGRVKSAYQNNRRDTSICNRLEDDLNHFLLQYQIYGMTIFKDWIVYQADALDYITQIHFDHYDHQVVLDCGDVPIKILNQLLKVLNISEEAVTVHGRLEIEEHFLFDALVPEFKNNIDYIAANQGYRLLCYQSQSYQFIKKDILKSFKFDKQILKSLTNDLDEPCSILEDKSFFKAVSGVSCELEGYRVLLSYLRIKDQTEKYSNIENNLEEYNEKLDLKIEKYFNLTKAEKSVVLKDFIHVTLPEFFNTFKIATSKCPVFVETLCRMADFSCMPVSSQYHIYRYDKSRIIFTIETNSFEDILKFIDFFRHAGVKTVFMRGEESLGFRKKKNDDFDEKNQYEINVDGEAVRKIFFDLKIKFEEIARKYPNEMEIYRKQSEPFFEKILENQETEILEHPHIVNCAFCSSNDRIKLHETVPYAKDRQHFFSKSKDSVNRTTVTKFPEEGITITMEFKY